MKTTAISHSNIALIKYWGRSPDYDPNLNIPLNDSVSMTKQGLDQEIKLQTQTTIHFSEEYEKDVAILNGQILDGRKLERIHAVINPLKKMADLETNFKMVSENDFPTQAGLASSAAGFAALALAATKALKLELTKEQISTYARLGSGSAARSIHGGFVRWNKGDSHETSFAEQVCKPNDFELNAVVALISSKEKTITSDAGHESALTSPFNTIRVEKCQEGAKEIVKAIKDDDFTKVGELLENSCKQMHCVMMTGKPSLFYWAPETLKVIHSVLKARQEGLETYFTIDAGPNVHCFCRPENRDEVQKMLEQIDGVNKTIPVQPAEDSFYTEEHLF